MRILVIYDDRRSEKLNLFVNELRQQGITEYQILPCVMLNNVVESISESFKTIIRIAKETKEDCICIMEDDVHFTNENSWKYFIENKPLDYDVYISGNYLIDNRIAYKSPLVKVKEWVGNQCIIVNEKYYDTWLNTDSKKHCDTVHSGLGDFYVCYPYPILQRVGWSSNNHAICDYNSALRPEDIWKGF